MTENPYTRRAGEPMDDWLKRIDPEVGTHIADKGSPTEWLFSLDPERREAVVVEMSRQLRISGANEIDIESFVRQDGPGLTPFLRKP